MSLQQKTAVITGGGTGIGLAIAEQFCSLGCKVAIGGRRSEVIEAAVKSINHPNSILGHQLDVAERESVAKFFAWANQELGKIDILVNSAGMNIPHRSMAETDPDLWDQVLKVNATGAFNCMREVLPQMRQRTDGLIINISSIAGVRASLLGGVAYSASKFAMTALGTCVALEDGQHNIRVSNIYPGEVETPILENRPVPVSAERRATMLQPEDVAAAAAMIACLPPRAHVADLVIKPTVQDFA